MERIGHVTDWWTGLDGRGHDVRCRGAGHRIRWERGELVACDHGDPDDERTLAALGRRAVRLHRPARRLGAAHRRPAGARPQPARRLGRRRAPLGWTLAEHGGRGDAAVRPATFGADLPLPSVPRIGRFPIYPRSWDESEAELIALLGLGGGVAERLVATVAATWARRLRPGANVVPVAVPQLRSALHARLLATLRGWLGEPRLSLTLELVGEDDPRSLSRAGGRIRAELPFAWLAEVWARRPAIVDGRFCLAAETGDGDIWELTTVAPDLHTVQRATLSAVGLAPSDRAPL